MKGIAIDYNGKTTRIAAGDGMLTISINDVNGKGYIYTAYTDYREQRRNVWHDHTPLYPGDRFHITVGEITPTPPVRSETDETGAYGRRVDRIENGGLKPFGTDK